MLQRYYHNCITQRGTKGEAMCLPVLVDQLDLRATVCTTRTHRHNQSNEQAMNLCPWRDSAQKKRMQKWLCIGSRGGL